MNVLDILFSQHTFHPVVSRGESFFRKFPHLPFHLMEFLISLLPGIFFALGILHVSVGGLLMVRGATAPSNDLYLMVNAMLAMSNGLFMLLAFSEIRHTTVNGWRTLFLINMISILQSILSILFSPQTIFSVIIYIFVTLYITYEFKPYFKKVI